MASATQDELNDAVTCLGCDQVLSGSIVTSCNEIARLPGVNRLLLLPDVHLKEKYVRAGYKATVPSSAVILSEPENLYPQFRSRGIGCGMMLVGTGISADDLLAGGSRLLAGLPGYLANDGTIAPAGRAGPRRSFHMSAADMMQMGLHGAPWVGRQFGLPDDALRGLFHGGSYLSTDEAADLSWDDFAPQWIEGQRRDGRQLGLDLGGNHFLEAQVVQDVPATPDHDWLNRGELVFLYHGSCNGLARVLRPDLVGSLVERSEYTSFSPGEREYDLVLRSVKLLLNWSAAARCLVLARLRSLLATWFPGVSLEGLRCVSEAPHNSVLVEAVDGTPQTIYRHNAVPIEPSRPVIVSGRHDHVSYLLLSGSTPEQSLHTLDHGVGAILGRNTFEATSTMASTSQRIERQYLLGRSLWNRRRSYPLIDPTVTEPLFRGPYQRAGVIERECYRLRPLATLKRKPIPLRGLLRFEWLKQG